jgi:hypothetical protein
MGRNYRQNNTKTQNTQNKNKACKTRKHMGGMEIILHSFLTSAPDGGDGSG